MVLDGVFEGGASKIIDTELLHIDSVLLLSHKSWELFLVVRDVEAVSL